MTSETHSPLLPATPLPLPPPPLIKPHLVEDGEVEYEDECGRESAVDERSRVVEVDLLPQFTHVSGLSTLSVHQVKRVHVPNQRQVSQRHHNCTADHRVSRSGKSQGL